MKSGWDGEEREMEQTFERRSCEINEQRKCHPRNKEHIESSIFSSHLIRELAIITQLTTGDPITSI